MKTKEVRSWLYDIPPQVRRTDAIQAFDSMEFPLVEIEDQDGLTCAGFPTLVGKDGALLSKLSTIPDSHCSRRRSQQY